MALKSLVWGNIFSKQNKRSVMKGLQRVVLFEDLTKRQMKRIVSIGHIRYFSAEEVVFYKEEPSYGLYIVLKGEIEVCIGKRVLQKYKPFDFFGEFSLVENDIRSATAVSRGKSTLFYIPQHELNKLFNNDYKLAFLIYKKMVKNLAKLVKEYDSYLIK
jgi:CRP-like cAMP-binding protein